MNGTSLSRDLVGRVLAKLEFSAWPSPSLEGLTAVYGAWCRLVPFDNVRKLIHVQGGEPGPLPGDDPVDFLEAWLACGAGGTCWAGNGALQALLAALGFRASRAVGTLLVAPNVPPNHGSVVVRIDGARYLVDASMLHGEPLPLIEEPTRIGHPAWGVSCAPREGRWHIHWRPLHLPNALDCTTYRLEETDAPRERFTELHERTRRWSPFNYQLYCRTNRAGRVVGIACGRRVEFDAAGALVQRPLERGERLAFLVEILGISESLARCLPADRPTPPPPNSRKARVLLESGLEASYA
jgi:N-hydroxyarylamine O-acetyltransferase